MKLTVLYTDALDSTGFFLKDLNVVFINENIPETKRLEIIEWAKERTETHDLCR